MKQIIDLGYSPCPNDCFIFDALVHNKIDTGNYKFNAVLEDVETLNKWAFEEKLPVTKLSYHAFIYLTNRYNLLNSGSALGFNCGPLLVSKKNFLSPNDIKRVAIPGKYTTANFLLSIALPQLTNKVEFVFSDIEDAVLNEKVDAGLIIHENRFTFEQCGLKKIIDLGEYWDGLIKAPIPLGGIVASKKLNEQTRKDISKLISESVAFAFKFPNESLNYVKQNAQSMSEDIMQKHIQLYVNEFSLSLGHIGKNAVQLLFDKAKQLGIIDYENIFLID